jgi:hypothetical protein
MDPSRKTNGRAGTLITEDQALWCYPWSNWAEKVEMSETLQDKEVYHMIMSGGVVCDIDVTTLGKLRLPMPSGCIILAKFKDGRLLGRRCDGNHVRGSEFRVQGGSRAFVRVANENFLRLFGMPFAFGEAEGHWSLAR